MVELFPYLYICGKATIPKEGCGGHKVSDKDNLFAIISESFFFFKEESLFKGFKV